MFGLGEKVIVLSSSSKTKTGPKRGSIAYTRPNDLNVKFGIMSPKFSIGLSILDLTFVRYGFSKERTMPELGTVLGVFPILKYSKGMSIEEDLEEFLRAFKGQNFKSPKWDQLKEEIGAPIKTSVCVVAPIIERKSNILDSNAVNFIAWFESIMWNKHFKSGLVSMKYKTVHNKFDATTRDYILALRKCCTNRNEKLGIVKLAVGDPVIRKLLVFAIRQIIATTITPIIRANNLITETKFSARIYHSGPYPAFNALYEELIKNIFSDYLFDYKQVLASNAYNDKVYANIKKQILYPLEKTKIALKKEALILHNIKRSPKVLDPVR